MSSQTIYIATYNLFNPLDTNVFVEKYYHLVSSWKITNGK